MKINGSHQPKSSIFCVKMMKKGSHYLLSYSENNFMVKKMVIIMVLLKIELQFDTNRSPSTVVKTIKKYAFLKSFKKSR